MVGSHALNVAQSEAMIGAMRTAPLEVNAQTMMGGPELSSGLSSMVLEESRRDWTKGEARRQLGKVWE
ncbi:unnamed protein product [Caenorhabditis auriculariae]|uniref:Uncharacterized protein n=1 Tax=Caenorhabditis auriculariae TaxID=2777116 RepID=A0A8S1GWW9_9PELO|nr:unnamed protein product [Caenorhabditis auriculariae]